jgi:hypothetical protein
MRLKLTQFEVTQGEKIESVKREERGLSANFHARL